MFVLFLSINTRSEYINNGKQYKYTEADDPYVRFTDVLVVNAVVRRPGGYHSMKRDPRVLAINYWAVRVYITESLGRCVSGTLASFLKIAVWRLNKAIKRRLKWK